MQANFGIVKFTPRRLHSFWPHALTLIWRKMSSMHSGTNTPERGGIRLLILYRIVEHVDKSAKRSFCIILRFGATPDPENMQAHPGFVWVKSGYSESIAWRKVRLTKQRNVDLTTHGLWAMPLNTGWVPVKARRLQDWEKLKKYVPIHKQGDVPQWGPCPCGRGQQ